MRMFGIPDLGFLVAAAAAFIMGGCSTVDITDRPTYDRYYAESAVKLAAGTSPKLVFYVPYKQFNASPHIIVDTTPVLDALKAVYGETIVFDKSPSAPYVVDVTNVEEWINKEFRPSSRLAADFTANGRTMELITEYDMPGDVGMRIRIQRPYELYRAAALQLAGKIKILTSQSR